MAPSNHDRDVNNNVSTQSFTGEKTATKRQQLTTSIGTLTSAPLLPILPFDLVSEILCRLPVNLLCQLRCLCKSFNSLISKFARKHLLLSTRRHHLMVSSMNNLDEFTLFDSPTPFDFSAFKFKETQPNFHNSRESRYGFPLRVCSCDGILCFTMSQGSMVVLWSPSIKKFKTLPPLKIPLNKVRSFFYSFGYDHFIHNYKVIAFSNFLKNKSFEVNVHTLGTDSWRRIQDFPYSHVTYGLGIFVSGTVNWLAYDHTLNFAIVHVSLDLEKESYRTLSHPDLEYGHRTLGVVRDCLCMFVCTNMFMDVWIMKEYGNIESWTKLYNVSYMGDRGLSRDTRVLYVSEDDQLLMNFYDLGKKITKLAVYDSKNVTLKFPEIQTINRWIHMEFYIESLISPCS